MTGKELEINVLGQGSFAERGLQNAMASRLIGDGDEDELIKSTRAHDGGVENIGTVGGPDDENLLLLGHAIHLGEKGIDYTVSSTASIAERAPTSASNGVQLIEEEDARGSGARFIEEVSDVAF